MNKISRPIFVITTGRSGSTLLQRYLNASPELVIWGEHGGFIYHFSTAYYGFLDNQHLQAMLLRGRQYSNSLLGTDMPAEADIEWTNNFTIEDFRLGFRDFILNVFTKEVPPSLRWGFKEIRYGTREVKFLRELFPEAQFIFMLRHPIDTLASMIAAWEKTSDIWEGRVWRQDEKVLKNVEAMISKHVNRIIPILEAVRTFSQENFSFFLRYEALTKDPFSNMREVCSFLNISQLSEEKIHPIANSVRMATNKSSIKEALQNDFRNNVQVVRLLEIFDFAYPIRVHEGLRD